MNPFDYKYGCLYGKNYDLDKEKFPDKNKLYDIILHIGITEEDANKIVFSSLEGLFVYNEYMNPDKKYTIKRDEIEAFEKKYNGFFIPFKKETPFSFRRKK